MLNFKKIKLDDIEIIKEYLKYNVFNTCDFTVGGIFMWRDFYHIEYSIYKKSLVLRLYYNNEYYYYLPLCEDIEFLINELVSVYHQISFCLVPEKTLSFFKKYNCEVLSEEDLSDYIYYASDIENLTGKKYSPQRNLIHQFIKNNPNWKIEDIKSENIEIIKNFFVNEYLVSAGSGDYEREENTKTLEVLDNIERYGFSGIILYNDSDIVGFSFGELLNGTLYVHIEKSNKSIKGSYQMLVNQFALKYKSEDIALINREEDMGDLGLRFSKQSYHPIQLLKKYIVKIK